MRNRSLEAGFVRDDGVGVDWPIVSADQTISKAAWRGVRWLMLALGFAPAPIRVISSGGVPWLPQPPSPRLNRFAQACLPFATGRVQ